MNKVILILGLIILVLFCIFNTIGEEVTIFTIKYQDNLVKYECNSKEEKEEIILKSQNDCLYFDGMYFYTEVPSTTTKLLSKAEVVLWEKSIKNGTITSKEFYCGIFTIIFCTLVAALMLAPTDIPIDYDY